MEKHRIEWVDLAKGIAILLVIVGHTDYSIFRHLIFSFHMPFFCVMSGYTFRASINKKEFWKHFNKGLKQLVLPAVFLVLFTFVYDYFFSKYSLTLGSFITDSIESLFFFNGMTGSFFGHEIGGIGVAWFLVYFFIAREIYDFLHMRLGHRTLFITVVFLSIIGVYISKVTWWPLSFDISLASMWFFYFGESLRTRRPEVVGSVKTLVPSMICWIGGGDFIVYSNKYFTRVGC